MNKQDGTKTELSYLKVTTHLNNDAPQDLENCPIRKVLDRISDKWSLLLLLLLQEKPKRFMQLRRELPDISQRMLTQTLRLLERDSLVSRTVIATVPISVTYALTDLGESFIDASEGILIWAEKNFATIKEARQNYDTNDEQ